MRTPSVGRYREVLQGNLQIRHNRERGLNFIEFGVDEPRSDASLSLSHLTPRKRSDSTIDERSHEYPDQSEDRSGHPHEAIFARARRCARARRRRGVSTIGQPAEAGLPRCRGRCRQRPGAGSPCAHLLRSPSTRSQCEPQCEVQREPCANSSSAPAEDLRQVAHAQPPPLSRAVAAALRTRLGGRPAHRRRQADRRVRRPAHRAQNEEHPAARKAAGCKKRERRDSIPGFAPQRDRDPLLA